MKTVCSKDLCAGCMACLETCPKQAITVQDDIYAYNAVIDENKCIDCNLCHNICQANNPSTKVTPILWQQGWANEPEVRKKSSSGGLAAAISASFIENGGVVCSCGFCAGEFTFSFAKTKEETAIFKGSKYIKSNPVGIYKEMQKMLKEGVKVLFIGLPCQVSAVKNYMGESCAENLFTIDLICHGTPSPKMLEYFLNDYKRSLSTYDSVSFRNKTSFCLSLDGNPIEPKSSDFYMSTFLNCVAFTENCYACPYASFARVGDITLGDSWGSSLIEEAREGISLVLCQTEKGKELLAQVDTQLYEVDIECATSANRQLEMHAEKPKERGKFMRVLTQKKSLSKAVWACYPIFYIKQKLKNILKRGK